MMRKLTAFVLLILPLILFAQQREIATVARVIDGDTIELGDSLKTKVRFIGVDTPETKHSRKPVEFYGPEASAYVAKQLDDQKILLVFDSAKAFDHYGRLLAYIHTLDPDTTDFCLELIKQGYAKAYVRYPHSRLTEYVKADSTARAQGIGLWSNPALAK